MVSNFSLRFLPLLMGRMRRSVGWAMGQPWTDKIIPRSHNARFLWGGLLTLLTGEELSDCYMKRLYTDTMADIKSLYSVSIFTAHTTIHVRHTRTHTTAKADAAHKHYCNFFSTTAKIFTTVLYMGNVEKIVVVREGL